ncbi:hypothetical protein TMatcc_004101 [Talaromyces marneffei ATCC 18224]
MLSYRIVNFPERDSPRTGRKSAPGLFPALDHNNMIPKPSLDFSIFGACGRARLKLICHFLKVAV